MSSPILYLAGGTPLYRDGITAALRQRFTTIVHQTLATLREQSSTLIDGRIIVVLPNWGGGRQAIEGWVERLRGASYVLIGRPVDLRLLKRCFARGLGGYLLPGTQVDHLVAALVALAEGKPYVDPALRELWVSQQLAPQQHRHRFVVQLTRREREVLQLVVEEFTTDEIARRLFISPCTVETHRANILGKLGVRNVAGLVREAMRLHLCTVA